MSKKLHISQIISTLAVTKPLSTIVIGMHNFIAKFRKIFEICKKFAGNQVNEKGNVPRRGVVPTFSDLEVGYLSVPVQLDLFRTANITLEVPYWLNQKNWRPPSWTYRRFRKRIETVFSQLGDQFMTIRNYAKQPCGLFTRMAAKVSAFTMLQYFNLINHRPIGQVKYALF